LATSHRWRISRPARKGEQNPLLWREGKNPKKENPFMNAIVTVLGQDRVGIIAAVCNRLADYNVNILDISQTILQGAFTMVMAVDVGASTASFGDLREGLAALGAEMGLSIRIQREEIFDAMHTI